MHVSRCRVPDETTQSWLYTYDPLTPATGERGFATSDNDDKDAARASCAVPEPKVPSPTDTAAARPAAPRAPPPPQQEQNQSKNHDNTEQNSSRRQLSTSHGKAGLSLTLTLHGSGKPESVVVGTGEFNGHTITQQRVLRAAGQQAQVRLPLAHAPRPALEA